AGLESSQSGSDPYRADRPVEYAECAECHQPFPSSQCVPPRCPACVQAADEALMRELAADAKRSRRNNLVFGSLLLALGLLVTLWTYQSSSVWLVAIGPIAVGAAGVMRGIVA
ncbi:MAG TPA: hypothetical protein VK601_19985, partial [Kofleriaceae bacterium]|nr:hypothetical protein [Kofleriaceae bacterium]